MSQQQINSPTKKFRYEKTSSHGANSNQGHSSPTQQSSVGANFDSHDTDFPFEMGSPSGFFTTGTVPTTPPMSYFPSHHQPSSSDWSLSMHNTTSVPENIFSEPMSPGLIANSGPSRAAPMNAGHAHNGSQSSRGNIKRGGAGNRRREPLTYGTHTDDNHHSRERAGSELSAGAAPGIALDAEDLGLDEEAQEHLSNNLKAINDRLKNSGNRASGRYTPDVSMDDFEGTRHGFYSGGEGAKKKGGANNAPAFPFSSFSQEGPSSGLGVGIGLGQGTAGYGVSQSLLGLTTFIPTSDCSGLSAPNSTQNKGFSGMKLSPEEQQRQLILRSETMEPTGSSSSHGGGGGGSVLNEVMEVEDGDSNSNIAGSQHSAAGGSSMMSGLAAITAAAENLPFPAECTGKGSSRRGTPSKKAQKARTRAFNGTPSSSALTFPSSLSISAEKLRARGLGSSAAAAAAIAAVAAAGSGTHLGMEENSNLTFETASSGHSGVGSAGAGYSGANGTGVGVGAGVSVVKAQGYAAYGTPSAPKASGAVASTGSSKHVSCNCKKSRCLKMYCDCFRLTVFCQDSCRCKECANVESKAVERQAAIDSIVERNPEAFKPRVTADPVSQSKGHLTGCHCRKSSCLKKYCECFTGAVPCGERCRCIDCKNAASIYSGASAEGKQRLILTSSLSAGVDRSQNNNPRKDSIGSDSSNMGSMDVMSAIMHDKRQYASILNSSMQLNALSSSYYDPEVSNLSVASLNYSNDAFPSSQQQHGGGEGGGHFSHLSYAGDSHLAFSPPRQGTEASSGANSHCSNRSILDNEEAAEVLSVMNSPNAYMTTRDRDRDTMEMERDREGIMGSFGSARSPAGSSTIYPPFGKSLLHSDFEGEEEGEEEGDEEDEDEEGGPAGLEARHCRLSQQAPSRRGMGLGGALVQEIEGSLLIETEPAVVAAATEQLSSRAHSYHSPPSSSYNSPVKPRRASTLDGDGGGAGAVLSPMQSLLNLAGICVEKQQQEEEQRKSQLNSPAAVLQRS